MSAADQLKKFFGFDAFKGNQEAVVNSLLEGHDTFVIMPTGAGKSLCYQLPALVLEGTAVVVSPLIALMKNQVDSLRGFSTENGIAHVLNSSLSRKEVLQVHSDLHEGVTRLLYVAPESLTKDENIELLRSIPISFYAIDEAHCISEWGHDFRPEYRNLRSIMNRIDRKPVIALTATATPKVQSDIQKNLGMEVARVFKSSFNRPNLFYEVRPKHQVEKELVRFVKRFEGKSGIVYCLSRKKVEEVAETLRTNGIKALPYHAGLDAHSRVRHQDAFLREEVDVIVATIAFGMGIDKPDVRFVVHYDIPKSLESYYQETGRAGRDGGEGHCLAFYSHKDIEKLEKFMNNKPVSEQEIGRQLLQDTVGYVETSCCRRVFLLHYFGEVFDEAGCGEMCDNCRNPIQHYDAQSDLTMVLELVQQTGQRLKAQHLADALRGETNAFLKAHKVSEALHYGKGQSNSELHWLSVVRQAVVRGFLVKDIESYGLLRLNEKALQYLANPTPFSMREDRDYQQMEIDEDRAAGAAVMDEGLFRILKELNRSVAKKKGVPPFAVFSEASLSEMCFHYPTTLDELKQIQGVGEGKARKFGDDFVRVIAQYVADNGIEKDHESVVKSVVNRSGNKVFIIQGTDRKLPMDDIARSKGMSRDELISEMEHIVHSGTRINIDYHLNELIDEEDIEAIFEWFMAAESDDLREAYEALDGDYDEEILRLVRLKFLSEVGN
ncbi:DNA helicase RecQ [bacterium]|nr:DNA helicase RecQ [bacterium]